MRCTKVVKKKVRRVTKEEELRRARALCAGYSGLISHTAISYLRFISHRAPALAKISEHLNEFLTRI